MKIGEVCAVIYTISSGYDPSHGSSACIVKTFSEAKEYLKKNFEEYLMWDKEDFGENNVQFTHDPNWIYAKIQIQAPRITREFYVTNLVYDPK